MSFSFFKQTKPKSSGEIVRHGHELLCAVGGKEPPDDPKVLEEAGRYLQDIRVLLQGDGVAECVPENSAIVTGEVLRIGFLDAFIRALRLLDWEARRDGVHIFTTVLEKAPQYMESHPYLLDALIQGYDNKDAALNCGNMLRECLRYPMLAKLLLEAPNMPLFFRFMDVANFDVASDAFTTFKEMLRRHKQIVCAFLDENYTQFFTLYETLLTSQNYVTRRQSIKLLGELLLDRANVAVMLRFIGDEHNLRVMMTLLKDPSRNIQFEAFHVFKVFVANPDKPERIVLTLKRNRDRLLQFLRSFNVDKEDEQFEEEKLVLAQTIKAM